MNFDISDISAESLILLYILVFAAGFVDSIAGGGGLISLPAYFLTGMPTHYALGCNKLSAGCGTLAATIKFFRGGVLDWRVAAVSAVFSFLGATGGTNLALLIDGNILKKIFLIALPIVAVILLTRRNFGEENLSDTLSRGKKAVLAALIGLIIGFYDGLIGPGTGTFAIMGYSILMKYDLKWASGNAKLLNLASNTASVITFALAGSIVYKVALPAALLGIAGGYTGSSLALKKGAAFIRPVMAGVLVLLMIKLGWDVFSS